MNVIGSVKGLSITRMLPWLILAVVMALAGTHAFAFQQGVEVGTKAVEVTLFAERAEASKKMADFESSARATEQRLSYELMLTSTEAAQRSKAADADAHAAAAVGDQLQDRVQQLAASCRATVDDTAAAITRDAADASGRMLALMFRRTGEAQERVAAFADAAHIAGVSCLKSYVAVKAASDSLSTKF